MAAVVIYLSLWALGFTPEPRHESGTVAMSGFNFTLGYCLTAFAGYMSDP